jgi:alginate O-acetyltransferase complex protein AlgI
VRIPQNFASPYKATDPSDFWRRWHISLSTCLRDYVYVPLGGNRRSVYRNLLLTMLIGGLWHGANWTFVVWGAYHGVLLVAYRRFSTHWDGLPIVARRAAMFLAVTIGWVFFRSTSFAMAGAILKKMFSWQTGQPIPGAITLAAFLLLCTALTQFARNSWELSHDWKPRPALGLAVCFALSLAVIYAVNLTPFLYFQF